MAKKQTFSDQMRTLIENSGQTCYRISKATGVDTSTLSRFLHGQGGLSNQKLDDLASYLGWTITVETKAEPKQRKAGK
jgi:hypothetical protein